MRDAFVKGVQNFLIEAFSDPNRKKLTENRLNELIIMYPVDTKEQGES